MVDGKKVINKKDFSNTVVAVVLVVAIILSFVGTLIVMDGLSSAGSIITIVSGSNAGMVNFGTGQPTLLEPVSAGGKVGITVQKPDKGS